MSTDLTSLWKSWRTRLLQHQQVGRAIGGVSARNFPPAPVIDEAE